MFDRRIGGGSPGIAAEPLFEIDDDGPRGTVMTYEEAGGMPERVRVWSPGRRLARRVQGFSAGVRGG